MYVNGAGWPGVWGQRGGAAPLPPPSPGQVLHGRWCDIAGTQFCCLLSKAALLESGGRPPPLLLVAAEGAPRCLVASVWGLFAIMRHRHPKLVARTREPARGRGPGSASLGACFLLCSGRADARVESLPLDLVSKSIISPG